MCVHMLAYDNPFSYLFFFKGWQQKMLVLDWLDNKPKTQMHNTMRTIQNFNFKDWWHTCLVILGEWKATRTVFKKDQKYLYWKLERIINWSDATLR